MKVKPFLVALMIGFLSACSGLSSTPQATPGPTVEIALPTSIPTSSPTPEPVSTTMPLCYAVFNPIGFWPDNGHILGILTVDGKPTTWLQVFDITNQQSSTLLEVDQFVNIAALSPDHQVLAWTLPNFDIQLVRLQDGQIMSTLAGHTGTVNALVFSPDGERLYSGSADESVKVWDLSGRVLYSFQPDGADNLPAEVMGLGISPDGSRLITIPAEGNAKAWKIADYQKIGEYPGTIFGAYSGAKALYSPDGQFIAIGLAAGPGATTLWRSADSVMVWEGGFMSAFDFSPDDRFFAYTLLGDENVQFIVIGSADGQTTFQKIRLSSSETVWKLLFSPDSAKLVSVANTQINVWNVENGKLFKSYTVPCP